MQDTRALLLHTDFPAVTRDRLDTLQLNLGYRCNLSCTHCHVNAGPQRTEQMSREVIDQVMQFAWRSGVSSLDLTGGAPEMNPYFRELVVAARGRGVQVTDRCNLTILEEPGFDDLAEFLAVQQVRIVASLPCYLQDNVNKQRGNGVFQRSIEALQRLNELGYGRGEGLELDLVYNPVGAYLPPPQGELEADYKRELGDRFAIEFDRLLTITNMPISRFGAVLLAQGEFDNYLRLLKGSYNEQNLDGLMCRDLVSIDWRGYVYDCDFNQMIDLPLRRPDALLASDRPKVHVSELLAEQLQGSPIRIGEHCYGCAAGQGSSCGGALEG